MRRRRQRRGAAETVPTDHAAVPPAPTTPADPAWLTPTVTRAVLLGIVALFALITLPFLMTYPPVDHVGDEAWVMSVSRELWRTGRPLAAIHAGTPLAEKVPVTVGWAYQGLLALFLGVLGPQVWAGRLLSFLCGAGVLVLSHLLGARLAGRLAGLAAALLLATSLAFSWHARETRPEAMLLLATTLAVYLFVRGLASGRPALLFAAGLTAALAVEVHPNGALVAISVVPIYAVARCRRLLTRSTLALGLGLALGLVVGRGANGLPGDTAAFQTMHKKYVPPVVGDGVGAALEAAYEHLVFLVHPRGLGLLRERYGAAAPLALVYLIFAVVVAALAIGTRRRPLALVVGFVPTILVAAGFLVGEWNWFHFSILWPIGAVAAGVALVGLGERLRRRALRALAPAAAAALLAVVGLVDLTARNLATRHADFSALTRAVAAAVPPGGTVMGDGIYSHALLRRPGRFTTFNFLEERCPPFEAAVRARGIDYVLADDTLMIVTGLWCSPRYFQAEILPFLRARCTLLGHVPLDYPHAYARDRRLRFVQVYRVATTPAPASAPTSAPAPN